MGEGGGEGGEGGRGGKEKGSGGGREEVGEGRGSLVIEGSLPARPLPSA